MTSYTEAAAQLRQDARNPQLSGATFAALGAFAGAQVAAAKEGGKPQFAVLISALDGDALLALTNRTNCFGVWLDEAKRQIGRDMGPARALVDSLRSANSTAVRRLVEIWQTEAPRASEERCRAIGLAMAQTISYGSDLGGSQCEHAIGAFADALYRSDASPEMRKRTDAVVGHIMALQSRGYHEPFGNNPIAALDFRDAVASRRPGIDAVIDAAVQADMGVVRDIGMVLKNDRGGKAPPRTEPKVRDVRMETYKLWEMEMNGQRVTGRDPFDGPAAIRTDASGHVLSQNYLWKGERLGADLAVALDTLKSIDPQSYAACAQRFVDEFQGDPATLPEPLRDVHGELTARRLVAA